MDGPEGERHPEVGAHIMGCLFGRRWFDLCLYHSRYYSKRAGRSFSRLCVADKLSPALEPRWLYLMRVKATGEVLEYSAGRPSIDDWYAEFRSYMRKWVYAHRDGEEDTWTRAREE
mgnify:FL=1